MLSLVLLTQIVLGWTQNEVSLYQNRKFFELQLQLELKQNKKLSKLVAMQLEDIKGCKEIADFSQKTSSITKCISFLNRETDLKIINAKNQTLIEDINNLCIQKRNQQGFFEVLLNKKLDLTRSQWQKCRAQIWEQVYLYAEEHFKEEPVKTMSIIRKARRYLGVNKLWEDRLKQIINL